MGIFILVVSADNNFHLQKFYTIIDKRHWYKLSH